MKPMMACMVAATLAAAPAFAQTTTTPATPVTPSAPAPMAPATTAPAPSSAPTTGMSGSFIPKQEMGQMLASKLIGTTVVSQNNETIGDVNDVLFDRGGQVMAAVIGVGGFLGIGEKDVAVPFQQLEFVVNNPTPAAANTAPPATTVPPATMSTTTNQPATTGATTTMTTAPRDAMPNRVMLKMTKAELQSAPTFEEYTAPAATMPSGGATTTVPRQ